MIHQAQRKIKGFASFQESINKSGFFSYDWENSEKFPSREESKMQEPEQPRPNQAKQV